MIRAAIVKLSWIAMSDCHRLDAEFWLAVCEGLLEASIRPDSATDDQVGHAIDTIEARERAYGDVEPRGFY